MRILGGAVGILLFAGVSPAIALSSDGGDKQRVQEIQDLKDQIQLIESKLEALEGDAPEVSGDEPAEGAGLEQRLDEIIRQSPAEPLRGNSGFTANALEGVTWNGSFHWRAAYFGNFPGAGGEDDSLSFDQKLTLGIGGRLTEKTKLYAELRDARVWGTDPVPAFGADTNLEMDQAYLEIADVYGSGFDVKLGRHQIQHGAGRQFGDEDWYLQPNSRYDGITGTSQFSDNTEVSLHAVRLTDGDSVLGNEFSPNTGVVNANAELLALYVTHDAGETIGAFDLYYIYLDAGRNSGANFDTPGGRVDSSRLSTVGVRWTGSQEGIWWDTEIAKQFGNLNGTHIKNYLGDNWALAALLGYSMEDSPLRGVHAAYHYAEGGGDSYRQLNPSTHGWFGIMDVMSWSNVVHFELGVDVAPMDDDSTIGVSWHWLRLDDSNGGIGPSRTFPSGAGFPDRDVGQELDIVYECPCGGSSMVEAGFGYFFPGEAYKNAFGSSNDVLFGFMRYGISF